METAGIEPAEGFSRRWTVPLVCVMSRDQAIETVLGVLRWWFAFEKKPESLPLLAERIVDALGVGQPVPELERLRRVEAAAREVVEAAEEWQRSPCPANPPTTPPLWIAIARLRAVLSERTQPVEVPGADPGIGLEGSAGESRVPERTQPEEGEKA